MGQISVLMPHHKGNLPIRVLSKDVIVHFQSLYLDFLDEIKHEVLYGGLSGILINDHKDPIKDRACLEYEEDSAQPGMYRTNFYIEEPYIAFLWCLCYAVITLYREQRKEKPNLQPAVDIFNYGLSLHYQWSNWDMNSLPNPQRFDESQEQHIGEVNGLFLYAATYILGHEFSHQQFGHDPEPMTTQDSIQDELEADKGALAIMKKAVENRTLEEIESLKLGSLLGLGSILFPENCWDGGPAHPDADVRFAMLIDGLANADEESDLWAFGRTVLLLWGLIHQKDLKAMEAIGSERSKFYVLIESLKSQQNCA